MLGSMFDVELLILVSAIVLVLSVDRVVVDGSNKSNVVFIFLPMSISGGDIEFIVLFGVERYVAKKV